MMNLLRQLLEAFRRYLARRESVAAGAPVPVSVPFLPPAPPYIEPRLAVGTIPPGAVVVPPQEPALPGVGGQPSPAAPPAPPAPRAFLGPLGALPRGQAAIVEVFGDPGLTRAVPDPRWERTNLVVATGLPGRWNSGKGRLYVHRLVEPYLREALERCDESGVLEYITRLGCFNFRHMRHDPRMPLSRHSWGIAFDVNSPDNAGKYITHPPKPFSPAWRDLYPRGVPEALVWAFESVGFSWGGRWRGYVDPMHFQLGG